MKGGVNCGYDDEDYAIKSTARACVKVGAKSGTCFSCSWGETAVSIPASNPLAAGKLGTDSSSLDRRCPSRISIYITVVPCNEVEMEYPWNAVIEGLLRSSCPRINTPVSPAATIDRLVTGN